MIPTLVVLSFCADDSQKAENLLDFIFALNGKKSSGHILLVAANGVHAEPKERIKISAQLAFETMEIIELPAFEGDKVKKIGGAFKVVASHIYFNYRCNFIWLEPDCTPTTPKYLTRLLALYDNQIKRFLGGYRVAIFPNDSHNMVGRPMDFALTRTDAIQEIAINSESDLPKVSKEALLVHGDKSQILLNSLRSKLK